jgi:preprotein translocase subunit SecF
MAKQRTEFNFMAFRRPAAVISLVMLVVSIGSLASQQLNFGLDFTGGTLIEVTYGKSVRLEGVRGTLEQGGFGDAVVQHFGESTEVLVRVPPREGEGKADIGKRIYDALKAGGQSASGLELKRVEFVGPQVGEELRDESGTAMIIALALMLIYVAMRFRLKFALGAVAALFHDVIIVLGFFSLFHFTFDLTVLAAVLAVIGYSLNDTIVVFDRIRENFRVMREGSSEEIVNFSLNQMLGRTIITSATTLIVVLSLFLLGGELIHGFALALLIGICVGTYSSIYVASNITLSLNLCREDFLEPKVEEFDELP